MNKKEYNKPSLYTEEIFVEGVLCASGDEGIDFSTLGSEGVEDSGHTINWGK